MTWISPSLVRGTRIEKATEPPTEIGKKRSKRELSVLQPMVLLNAMSRPQRQIFEQATRLTFITVKEAASMLGLSPETVHHFKGGTQKLTRVRFGRSVRMIRQEVDAYIQQRLKASQHNSIN